jgi:diaminopimelate epimerase
MRIRFTKMQGAGNDFVVLDATQAPLALSREQLRHLGDRRFGIGADQILAVEAADAAAAPATRAAAALAALAPARARE